MKLATRLTRLATVLLVLGWAGQASAQPFPAGQDTVDVAPKTGPEQINALYNAITNDTDDGTATGTRLNPNRVYRLQRGGRYLMLTELSGTYDLNVVAAKPADPSDTSAPPIIQRVASATGDIPESIANTQGNQTWKGVYFLSPAPTGANSFFLIRSGADNKTLTFDNCTVEYGAGVAIQFDARGGSLLVTNSRFRNLENTEQIYAGRAAYFAVQGNADTPGARRVVFENNTFNTVGGFIFQGPRGGAGVEVEEFRFNHNTVYNVGLYPFLEEQWTDAIMANNLFVNALAYGETAANRVGQDPGMPPLLYGIFNVDALREGQVTSEANRRIGVIANANYRDPRFDAYYASTPAGAATKVEGEPFFNSRTLGLAESLPGFVVDRLYNDNTAPGFTTPPDNVDRIIQFRKDILMTPVPAEPTRYAYDPDGSRNIVTWPLPENLTYSNTAYQTGGINGYPLGDLNWYPAQKAAWAAGGGSQADYDKANDIIDGIDGGGNQGAVIASAEAEDVTLTGNTTVKSSGDRAPSDADASAGKYVYMEDTGTITWTFNVATAGDYTLRIRHQLPFDPKAQLLSMNGTPLVKDSDGGMRYFFNEPIGVWKDEDIDVTLVAGENTFVITKDFGYMYFDSFSILGMPTDAEDGPDASFQVSAAFPNPTTGQAQVSLTLAEPARVSVEVYDVLGRQVLTVPETDMTAGANRSLSIDGSQLSGGTYIYRVLARQNGTLKTVSGRMTVVR